MALRSSVAVMIHMFAPCSLGFLISLPFGIWALTVVLRHDVKTLFADEHVQPEWEQAITKPGTVVGLSMVFGMIVGLVLGNAFDPGRIGIYPSVGMLLEILCGSIIDMNNRRKYERRTSATPQPSNM